MAFIQGWILDGLFMDKQDIINAIEQIRRIVGQMGLDVSGTTRDWYARSTSLHPTRPLGVAYPTTVEQVQGLARTASQFRLALHPVSRGRNWGYGDATAPTHDQLILDLSRMNRIVEAHERSAYVVIEPGVSQGELYDYLRDRDIPLCLDCTGAGRDASLVGNALERGFGHTPYSDHFRNLCGLQVVLADGRILETGMCRFLGARTGHVYPHGLGPSLDGLFAQSNLGIVTRAGLWLMPRPEAFCTCFVRTTRDEDLASIVDRVARLRLHGVIRSAVHIGNDFRVMAARMRYPWGRAGNRTPLPDELRSRLRHEMAIGRWNMAAGLYGDVRTVRAAKRTLRITLRPLRVMMIDDRKLAFAKGLGHLLGSLSWGRRLHQLIAAMEPTYRLLKGEPVDEPLHGAAWRIRGPDDARPRDPRDIHAGLLWVSPVLPATGEAAREVVNIVTPIYARHQFEPLLSFTFVNDRALVCVCQISFDVRENAESNDAQRCYHEISESLRKSGFFPYRTHSAISGFSEPCAARERDQFADRSSVFQEVAEQIKGALDPAGTISPRQ